MAHKHDAMGYPLPDGDAFEEQLECLMVFIPARDEYRRAFRSALGYFQNWVAWQRDTDKRGIDAAHSWELANFLTWECYDMNTCETILALLTEIRDNTGLYCCDIVDVSDGDQYTDPVDDGTGNVPQNVIDAGYATGVSDWAGFDDYKCIVAHLMIDNMAAQTAKMLTYMLPSGAVLGGVAALAAIAAVILTGGGAVLVYGIVLAIALASGLYAAASLLGEAGLSDLVDDLATHHDALACAIYLADGSDSAVVALKAEIDILFSAPASTFLKSLNVSAQLKALYAGRYDLQNVAQILADEGYVPGDFECCVPAPPAGAFAWPIEITNVAFPPDDATFTTHSSSWDSDGFTMDVTHHPDSGHYYNVTLTLAASPYWGTGSHRGIVYRGVRYTYNSPQDIVPDGGIQDVNEPAGYDNTNQWRMLYSSPYPDFDDDIEAYLGITFSGVFGTHGLQQNPDQSRTLVLRFWCKDINDPNHRWNGYMTQMYWAIDNN